MDVCTGAGHKPALDFSFQQHDFGACLVKQPGMQAVQKTLRLKNNDTSDLSFDIEWVAQSPCLLSHLCSVSSSELPCKQPPGSLHAKMSTRSNHIPLAGIVRTYGTCLQAVMSPLVQIFVNAVIASIKGPRFKAFAICPSGMRTLIA